jgi:hypothetical protein
MRMQSENDVYDDSTIDSGEQQSIDSFFDDDDVENSEDENLTEFEDNNEQNLDELVELSSDETGISLVPH